MTFAAAEKGTPMTIGQKIKQLRKENGLSRERLADMLFINRTTVLNWENDDNEPHLYSLIGMADIFGVTLDELCCYEKERK
jgi:transcriptional regulator with XRE-family HTH domain